MIILSYFNFLISKLSPNPVPKAAKNVDISVFAMAFSTVDFLTFNTLPRKAKTAWNLGSRFDLIVPAAESPSTRNISASLGLLVLAAANLLYVCSRASRSLIFTLLAEFFACSHKSWIIPSIIL